MKTEDFSKKESRTDKDTFGIPIKKTPPEVWAEYEKARAYNDSLNLYETVRRNEEFYIGEQWRGLNAPDLEKPVLNIFKRVCTYFISMLSTDDIAVSLRPFFSEQGSEQSVKLAGAELERVMERTKLKAKGRELIRDCAVDGDGCFYFYFDPESKEIAVELVDNTKILFGNPYGADVQKQPYLILVKREYIDNVRAEAQKNGVDAESIRPDDDSVYSEQDSGGDRLVTVLVKLWREKGTVHFMKCTRDTVIKKPTDTGYRLYPVAYMNWERRKSSYHGVSPMTGLIPNQVAVNKLFAMAIHHEKAMAFPKLFYDITKVPRWTNRVGEAVAVQGNPNEAIAASFRGADMSGQVMELVDRIITYTKEFMGASDAALGNVKPDNTSAIIAVQKASSAPLELQRLSFYQLIEDSVRIMIDIMRADYGVRKVEMTDTLSGQQTTGQVDFAALDLEAMEINVDVGASSYWSELTQIQTMDNLFTKGIITDAVTYLESIPDKYIRNKNKIVEQLRAAAASQMAPVTGIDAAGGLVQEEMPADPMEQAAAQQAAQIMRQEAGGSGDAGLRMAAERDAQRILARRGQ
ncbi:hypothetical protein [Feifania hominis]|uniref:Portal protein n=1 Tax=Feifania hominis TaxID=2763660 RepID=A0A926DH97_9FIRM|nr:hypothetical protein [Feifania hominis]MBC8537269.1 hypothetical protein [Feifania hominis]